MVQLCICGLFHFLFSYGYGRILSTVSCPNSRTLLLIHPIYNSLHLLTPNSNPSLPLGNHKSILCILSLLLFHRHVHLCHVLYSTYKWYHMISVFFWLTSLSMIISSCIHLLQMGCFIFYGWVIFHWGGHGNPIQYSCLENPMDRGA